MKVNFKEKTVKTKKGITTFNNIFWYLIIRGSLIIALSVFILLIIVLNHLINLI